MVQQKEQTSSALEYRAVGRCDNPKVSTSIIQGLTDLPKVPWHGTPRDDTPDIDTTYCIRRMFVCLHDFIHESQILSHA